MKETLKRIEAEAGWISDRLVEVLGHMELGDLRLAQEAAEKALRAAIKLGTVAREGNLGK